MPCIICGAGQFEPVSYRLSPDMEAILERRGQREGYHWRLCMSCGNAQPSVPPDLDALEEAWQLNRSEPLSDAAVWAHRRRIAGIGASRSWDVFSPLHAGQDKRRFLDIACGLGMTVKRFQEGGWEALGNDIDATMKPFHDELGINSVIGPIERTALEGSFDLIQIAYAIYFISDPRAYLAGLRALLRPGGHLAIVMADHLTYTQSGRPSYTHTFIPTAESMVAALAHAGYRTVLRRRIRDTDFIAATPAEVVPPKVDTGRILRAHRTHAMRWALFGANRERLKRLLGK
jgi:SAM-dependent methyltransferase